MKIVFCVNAPSMLKNINVLNSTENLQSPRWVPRPLQENCTSSPPLPLDYLIWVGTYVEGVYSRSRVAVYSQPESRQNAKFSGKKHGSAVVYYLRSWFCVPIILEKEMRWNKNKL
jgi:hypothetical protein